MQMLLRVHSVSPVSRLPFPQQRAFCPKSASLVRIDQWREYQKKQKRLLSRASAEDGFLDRSVEFRNTGENRTEDDSSGNTSAFCIIEGPETVQDFASMQLQEIRDNIRNRRHKIFLLMEEVRRLRIQQRIKSADHEMQNDDENDMPNFPSFIPFLPPLTTTTLKQYYIFCFGIVAGVILFGGLLAPMCGVWWSSR